MQDLQTMSATQLVEAYNTRAALLGEPQVKRFADKTTALRRTTKIMKMVLPDQQKKATKTRKKRGVYFKLPYNGPDSFREVRPEDSPRGRSLTLVKVGATCAQVQKLVNKFDKDTDRTTGNVERRSYEIVRIMHYYLGWGIDHDQKTGIIKLHKRG